MSIPYACHNQPRPVFGRFTHYGQDGYNYSNITSSSQTERIAVVIPIHHVMTTECQRGLDGEALKDSRCTGCKHIKG